MAAWSFFFLPVFLYVGVAGQASGLYLCGIILPLFALGRFLPVEESSAITKLGLCLLVAWLIFPLSSVLNLYWPHWEPSLLPPPNGQTPRLFASQLSSTWIVTSLWLVGIGAWLRQRGGRGVAPSQYSESSEIFRSFVKGFSVAAFVFLVYFVFQHLTGFDYRRADNSLGPQNLMGDRYRIFGFYGHPLSIAGVSLCLFSFFGTIALFGPSRPLLNYGRKTKYSYRFLCAWVALANLLMLVMSGGRTAIVTGVAILILGPIFGLQKRIPLAARGAMLVAAIAAAGVMFFESGINHRFAEAAKAISEGRLEQIDSRIIFWKVHLAMIEQSPWYGHGIAHLKSFLREGYYDLHGLADYHRKYNAHNIYIETLVNVGLVGAFAMVALLISCFKVVARWCHADRLLRTLLGASVVAIFANAVHGLTQNVFFDASVLAVYLALFWFVFWFALSSRKNMPSQLSGSNNDG